MTLSSLQLPAIPDIPPLQEYNHISFYHPYNGSKILVLPKVDINSNSEIRALHTKTGLSACYVIAHNTPGFFSVNRDRTLAITAKLDAEFLDVDKVFYHLDDETIPIRYPICTRFKNWKFPHSDLEFWEDWKAAESQPTAFPLLTRIQSEMSEMVKFRDGKCRTTNYPVGLNTCHLIPKVESRWVCPHS
jgi:hypothetical protein